MHNQQKNKNEFVRFTTSTEVKLTGSFVALVTPFNRNGLIDKIALAELVEFQTANDTLAIFFLGTAGEKASLSDNEWREIVSYATSLPRMNSKFYFGCMNHNLNSAKDCVRFAKENGADGAVLTVPPYVGPTPEESSAFFLDIADSSDLPLGIYNNPIRLMTDMTPMSLAQVFNHPNVVVYKEGTNNTGQAAEIITMQAPVAIMAADTIAPDIITPIMALGGHGICNAFGNVAPKEASALSKPWVDSNDSVNYRNEFLKLYPLIAFTYSARSPVAIKALMRSLGLPGGYPRAPLGVFSDDLLEKGKKIAASLGIPERYGLNLR